MAKNSMFDLDVQVTSVKKEASVQMAGSNLICTVSCHNCSLTHASWCPTNGPICDI